MGSTQTNDPGRGGLVTEIATLTELLRDPAAPLVVSAPAAPAAPTRGRMLGAVARHGRMPPVRAETQRG